MVVIVKGLRGDFSSIGRIDQFSGELFNHRSFFSEREKSFQQASTQNILLSISRLKYVYNTNKTNRNHKLVVRFLKVKNKKDDIHKVE